MAKTAGALGNDCWDLAFKEESQDLLNYVWIGEERKKRKEKWGWEKSNVNLAQGLEEM